MQELIEKIEKLLGELKSGFCNEELGWLLLTNFLYEHHQDNMLPLFLDLRQRELDKERKEKETIYRGLSESIANVSSLLELTNNKSRRKFNDQVKFITQNEAKLLKTAIAYCPKGVVAGSEPGIKTILNLVINLLLKNKDQYLKPGIQRDWAEWNGYLEWIEMVIKMYDV